MSYHVSLPLADCADAHRIPVIAGLRADVAAFLAAHQARWHQTFLAGPVCFTFNTLNDAILFKLTFGGTSHD